MQLSAVDTDHVLRAIQCLASVGDDVYIRAIWQAGVDQGQVSIIQYLVENHGIDERSQQRALRDSAMKGHLSVVQYFVQSGLRVYEALEYSACYGQLPVVKYLVEHGVDVHANGDAALRDSARHGYLHIIQYLLEQCGVHINTRGGEALRTSAWNGHLPVVKYLVEQGADIHATTDDDALLRGSTPVVRRYLQRVAFGDYMDGSYLLMQESHAHHATLLKATHKTMGLCVAMDVQHMVIEMLVGASVMAYFRGRRYSLGVD